MKRKQRDLKSRLKIPAFNFIFFKKYPWTKYPFYTLLGLIITVVIFISTLSHDLPSLSELEEAAEPLLVTRIYSADGKILDELSLENRIKVPISTIPRHLIDATIGGSAYKSLPEVDFYELFD